MDFSCVPFILAAGSKERVRPTLRNHKHKNRLRLPPRACSDVRIMRNSAFHGIFATPGCFAECSHRMAAAAHQFHFDRRNHHVSRADSAFFLPALVADRRTIWLFLRHAIFRQFSWRDFDRVDAATFRIFQSERHGLSGVFAGIFSSRSWTVVARRCAGWSFRLRLRSGQSCD